MNLLAPEAFVAEVKVLAVPVVVGTPLKSCKVVNSLRTLKK